MSNLHALRNKPRRRAAISLTPLIDVVFILLIFFMLASNFDKNRSIAITPPGDGIPSSAVKSPLHQLHILGQGRYRFSGQEMTLSALENALHDATDKPIVVKAAHMANLQDLIRITDVINRLGLTNISLQAPGVAD